MKRCPICKVSLPLSAFNKHGERKDGLQSHCKDCNRARSRAYYARNKAKHKGIVRANKKRYNKKTQNFLLDYLAAHPCIDCGTTNILVLEFDHMDRSEKLNNISSLLRLDVGPARMSAEVDKCEVRCANCHRVKTHQENNSYRYKFFLSGSDW